MIIEDNIMGSEYVPIGSQWGDGSVELYFFNFYELVKRTGTVGCDFIFSILK
jgi:hypothetical protein